MALRCCLAALDSLALHAPSAQGDGAALSAALLRTADKAAAALAEGGGARADEGCRVHGLGSLAHAQLLLALRRGKVRPRDPRARFGGLGGRKGGDEGGAEGSEARSVKGVARR
jgi:hypothetical protein